MLIPTSDNVKDDKVRVFLCALIRFFFCDYAEIMEHLRNFTDEEVKNMVNHINCFLEDTNEQRKETSI